MSLETKLAIHMIDPAHSIYQYASSRCIWDCSVEGYGDPMQSSRDDNFQSNASLLFYVSIL